jgi:hypothetical protein
LLPPPSLTVEAVLVLLELPARIFDNIDLLRIPALEETLAIAAGPTSASGISTSFEVGAPGRP